MTLTAAPRALPSSRPAVAPRLRSGSRRPAAVRAQAAATPKGACLRSEQCKHCPTCELGLKTDFLEQYDVEESAIGQGGFGQASARADT